MDDKVSKFKNAENSVKSGLITLYHVIVPVTDKQFAQIQSNGYFNPSQNALGGQSNGYYFFTTVQGAKNHIETNQDLWDTTNDKHAYLAECTVNLDSVKYPDWKLDYESMQDFLFDMIYDAACTQSIKFDDIEISAGDDKKLIILNNGKFSRIKNFCANDHSGLIEQVTDFLYNHDKHFKTAYDKLLRDVLSGIGENKELYAIKTTKRQKITKLTRIEHAQHAQTNHDNSQINKFLARYKSRNLNK